MKTIIQSLVMTVVLLCFGFLPRVQAVVPPPDGGYPNFTTAEGQNALSSLTTGAANTGLGWFSLKSVTTTSFNTGVGAGTLVLNIGDANTATGTAALLLNTSGNETRPMEQRHWSIILRAKTIRRSALLRSIPTPPAATPPLAPAHF